MPSNAPAFKAALFAACQSIYTAPVEVSYGQPGTDQEVDVVMVGNIRIQAVSPTLGTARRREETLDVEVTFWCYIGGGAEAQQPVTERAYVLQGLLEEYLRNGNNIFLAGSVRECLLISSDLTESGPDELAQGRTAELVATVRAHSRY